MGFEIIAKRVPASETMYFHVRRLSDWQIRETATPGFEAYDTASIGDYDHPMTPENSGYQTADFPAGLADGDYLVSVFVQEGGAPAEDDECVKELRFRVTGGEVYPLEAAPGEIDAAALLSEADTIETGVTLQLALARIYSVLCCNRAGAGTATEKFKDPTGTYDRVPSSVDGSGNRAMVTYVDTGIPGIP
jgi:hypothetical protein